MYIHIKIIKYIYIYMYIDTFYIFKNILRFYSIFYMILCFIQHKIRLTFS